MCVSLYMHNKYTQYTHTHILYKQKLLFLDVINRLTALVSMDTSIRTCAGEL